MNKIVQILREGMTQKVIIGEATTGLIAPHTREYIAVPIETDRLLIKTIEVTSNKTTEFYVDIHEEPEKLNSRYNSGVQTGECYDVLDMPYIDKSKLNTMHVWIENMSEFESAYTIEIRGIKLK